MAPLRLDLGSREDWDGRGNHKSPIGEAAPKAFKLAVKPSSSLFLYLVLGGCELTSLLEIVIV